MSMNPLGACMAMLAVIGVMAMAAPAMARRVPSPQPFETQLQPAIQFLGEAPVRWSLADRMKVHAVPGVSIAVIRQGKIAWARGYGVRAVGSPDRIDRETVFSVGSVSKLGTAAIAMRMVDAAMLDLDEDVAARLRRWRLPASPYLAVSPVTLRGLLSHTAGMNLPNFPDFLPDEPVPSMLDTLNGTGASKTGPLQIGYVPGSSWHYSGAGTQVVQLLIEDVTGLPFAQVAQQYLLAPLGMYRSSYQNPLPPAHGNIAHAHDGMGRPAALPRGYETFPEAAASGIWTTPSDYARLIIALIRAYQGQGEQPFIRKTLAQAMMTEVGVSPIGMGPFLNGVGATRRFFHPGSNDHYAAWAEGNLATGNGLVIFTNGTRGAQLIREIRRAIEVTEHWPVSEQLSAPRLAPTVDDLKHFAGTYKVVNGDSISSLRTNLSTRDHATSFSFRINGAKLFLQSGDYPEMDELIPTGINHFAYARDTNYQVEFILDHRGETNQVLIHRGRYSISAMK